MPVVQPTELQGILQPENMRLREKGQNLPEKEETETQGKN